MYYMSICPAHSYHTISLRRLRYTGMLSSISQLASLVYEDLVR
jgi:hypothetical protein